MGKYKTQLEEDTARLLSEKYNGVVCREFESDITRLSHGEPVEYVIGETSFLNARIDLSMKPMIPRGETAFWVKQAIEDLRKKHDDSPLVLADTFAGAGNVGVALLLAFPTSHVDISELDPKLKDQILLNIKKNSIDQSRARIITGDTLDGLTGPYDAIFAVPPYVPPEALSELDPGMIHHEPHLAFFAGDNGHEFHKRLINGAWELLKDGGTLYMEADMDDNDTIREMVKSSKSRWRELTFWPDPYGATPNVVLRK